MEKFIPPETVVDQLKCTLCDSYLSVSPVYLISEDGNQYKCGRCVSIKTMMAIRANMYEHLAKLMTFPCSYKECSEKIAYGEVRDHEKSCSHRSISCPKSNCHDSYMIWSIASHFKEKHNDLFHSNVFLIKNVYAYYNVDVLEKNGRTYISLFDFDDINFGISICAIDSPNGGQYDVKLSSDNSKYSITISNQNVISFNEREHCFKCVTGSCKSKFHVYRDNRKEVSKRMTTKINRESVKKLFGSGLITYTITVHDKSDIKEEAKEKNDTKDDVKDSLIRKAKKIFLQMLECPICKEYMAPPIYQCLAGHTMCGTCKSKAEGCPTAACDAKIANTRNYALEEVSKKVELPQFDDKKPPKIESGIKRSPSEEVDGQECPLKVQKK